MKRIRRSRTARALSWLLTVVMITSIATGLVSPQAAGAQVTAGGASSNAQDVVVVRFSNPTGVLGDSLAMDVTNQVANELSSLGKYVPLQDRAVDEAIRACGLKPPFDQLALSRLATELSVNTVVTGVIESARLVSPKGGVKTAYVKLRVRVTESSSGDLLSGAAQIGEAKSRPGVGDDDTLIREAGNNAAVLAVKQIAGNTLPTGTVISTVQGVVLVNRGSRDGVAPGMKLIVLRERQRVGTAVVTSVFPNDCEARVQDNALGIRPEDKVRAVFPMPEYPDVRAANPTGARRGSGSSISSLAKILGVLLVGAAVVAAVSGGRNNTVSTVTAEAMLENRAPAVRVTWRNNMWSGGILQQYHVWRTPGAAFNFTGVPIAAVDQLSRDLVYVDHATPTSFWDGVRSFLQPQLPGSNGTGGTGGNTGNGLGETVTPGVGDAGTPLGFVIGQTATYSVNSVIRRAVAGQQDDTGTGGGTTVNYEDIWSDLVFSGPVTPVLPATLQLPTNGYPTQRLDVFQPTWIGTAGASIYQVEVSTDGTFTNPTLIAQLPPVALASQDSGGGQVRLPSAVSLKGNAALRLDPTFKAFDDGTSTVKPTLYWRVGARNDGDKPGPVDAIRGIYTTTSRQFRFIYSPQPFSFQPEAGPPTPP